ncbi:MAG: hypothetical protein Q7R95_06840 [bacterium]|nr:hypothetical protein [bacterium]
MVLILLFLLIIPIFSPVHAFDLTRPNNKFGIHLAQPHLNELKKVAEMVNGNGGDWGYITLVMQEDDRNHQKWQEIFDLLRENHLIPIIRLATKPEGDSWKRPDKEDAESWANFLENLNWVVRNRYIVLFNEPNHGSEWGNTVDTDNYANTAKNFAEKLKAKSPDFFIMLAGLDASAPSSMPVMLDEETFLTNTIQKITVPDFEKLFDGLSSHSYPNPAFSGSPWDYGRRSIHGYQWELDLLKQLGVNKKLSVFITETGWSADRLSRQTISSYFQQAFQEWNNDDRIIAVTPFVYDYQGEPFLNFSWKMFQTDDFYQQYYTVKDMQKQKGNPEIIDVGEINVSLPKQLVVQSNYHFIVTLKNLGQTIWDKDFGYELQVKSDKSNTFNVIFSDIKSIKPNQEATIDLYLKTNSNTGLIPINIQLLKNKEIITKTLETTIEIVPLPSLVFRIDLYPKLNTTGDDFEIQVFDDKEGLIFKKTGMHVKDGTGTLNEIQNIIPGKKYRVVILKPYYLPRQKVLSFKRGENLIKFKRMFPLDLNSDGKFEWQDLGEVFTHPDLISLFFP